ncbi:DUF115 domain-containing protein [Thermosphaera chiliense]|uniref:6-hydroxymethyl-7,8-dihydropterin pyrophosphokinase n=1 Tax=Thermosphaera chiliense TaxID=3402707 RepID=A0A7M1UPN9_9CREN|nr:6-hydroxymethylpterin diphosphokinase MptE-like protein [Thermosphaera aggregans]QOR93949.1 DUF115 domain-containing protein [Thermosphaera aggregans]
MSWVIDREWWMRIYADLIVKSIDLSFEKDQQATDLLSTLLDGRSNLIEFDEMIGSFKGFDESIVFGCGPSLVSDLEFLMGNNALKDKLLISADGATTVLINHDITPHIVVTDLDGLVADIAWASLKGSVIVVHAHGDNIDRVSKFVPMFKGRIIGSTQVEPRPHVYNFGGFTDGDRGVFLSHSLGISRIILAGFDLDGEPYSCPGKLVPFNKRVKKKKLEIAKTLLKELESKGVRYFNVKGEPYVL